MEEQAIYKIKMEPLSLKEQKALLWMQYRLEGKKGWSRGRFLLFIWLSSIMFVAGVLEKEELSFIWSILIIPWCLTLSVTLRIWCIIHLRLLAALIRKCRGHNGSESEPGLICYPDFISSKSNPASWTLSYKEITHMIKNEMGFFLFLNNHSVFFISPAWFQQGDPEGFQDFITEKTKEEDSVTVPLPSGENLPQNAFFRCRFEHNERLIRQLALEQQQLKPSLWARIVPLLLWLLISLFIFIRSDTGSLLAFQILCLILYWQFRSRNHLEQTMRTLQARIPKSKQSANYILSFYEQDFTVEASGASRSIPYTQITGLENHETFIKILMKSDGYYLWEDQFIQGDLEGLYAFLASRTKPI